MQEYLQISNTAFPSQPLRREFIIPVLIEVGASDIPQEVPVLKDSARA
jgi:hypothetical protein